MVEIQAVKKPSDLKTEDIEEEEKVVEVEEEPSEEEEELAEVIDATEKSDRVKIVFEVPKKIAKKFKEVCSMLDCTQREFIIDALTEKIAKIEDLSYLDEFNLSDPYIKVDELLAFLKAKNVTILTPKAIKRLSQNLKGKWAITLGKDKWQEFCEKLGLDPEEALQTTTAYIITWKK